MAICSAASSVSFFGTCAAAGHAAGPMASRAIVSRGRWRMLTGFFPRDGFKDDGVMCLNQSIRNELAEGRQKGCGGILRFDELKEIVPGDGVLIEMDRDFLCWSWFEQPRHASFRRKFLCNRVVTIGIVK
jgi:hypothetical protein